MKTLLLLFFLTGGSVALADDSILKNGDFSDGISHWEGDCHSIGSASDDSGVTSGVVVKLRSGDWTKINQDFDAKPGNYLLTITYTASPGLAFSQRAEDYTGLPGKMGLNGLGMLRRFPDPGQWLVIVRDTGVNFYTDWRITPKVDASGVQTVRLNVRLDSTDSFKKGFFVGFPPGDGFINLQSIMLVPQDAPAPAP
jgi:hypothetical protein